MEFLSSQGLILPCHRDSIWLAYIQGSYTEPCLSSTAFGSHPEGLTPQVWVWLGVLIFQSLPVDAATLTSVWPTPWELLLQENCWIPLPLSTVFSLTKQHT